MSWTYVLGIALLAWVAYDLFAGATWLHRPFYRADEPLVYWSVLLLWTLVAVSCFYW